MGSQQIVPAIAVHQVAGLAVDGDILLFVTFLPVSCLRVELNQSDGTEIRAVADPQTPRGGV